MKTIFKLISIFTFFVFFALLVTRFLVEKNQKVIIDGSEKYSVILSGSGSVNLFGKASGEIAPFFNILENPRDLKDTLSLCETSYEGKIYGNNVLIASTGMGKVSSTACITQLLQKYDSQVKEVIFVGIAGISRMQSSAGEVAKIGDVCINYLAFDYDLQYYTADETGVAEASPTYWDLGPEFSSRFAVGSKTLAEELLSNAKEVRTWKQEECIEATSDSFWHDIRSDSRAKEMAASYLETEPERVVIFTSMEAVAVGKVVERWNERTDADIDFAYVRSASNFDMPSVNPDGTPQKSGKDSLADRNKIDTDLAIEAASKPVLEMFKNR